MAHDVHPGLVPATSRQVAGRPCRSRSGGADFWTWEAPQHYPTALYVFISCIYMCICIWYVLIHLLYVYVCYLIIYIYTIMIYIYVYTYYRYVCNIYIYTYMIWGQLFPRKWRICGFCQEWFPSMEIAGLICQDVAQTCGPEVFCILTHKPHTFKIPLGRNFKERCMDFRMWFFFNTTSSFEYNFELDYTRS